MRPPLLHAKGRRGKETVARLIFGVNEKEYTTERVCKVSSTKRGGGVRDH